MVTCSLKKTYVSTSDWGRVENEANWVRLEFQASSEEEAGRGVL